MGFVQILSVVIALFCVTCVMSHTGHTYNVSIDGCSVTKTCRFFPSSCAAGDSDCIKNRRIITWKKAATSSSTTGPLIEIEMRSSPNAQYISIGFGRYNIMKDADVYYCTSTNTFATAAITVQYAIPETEPLENGVERTASSQIENAINCRFQRTMAVSKPSTIGEYSYDLLKESFHLLVAEGPTDSSNDHAMRYHNWRTATNDKINFTANFPADTPELTTPSAVAPSASATSSIRITTQQTTKQEKSTEGMLTPVSPEQTTSSALIIQNSFWMICAILIHTTLYNWRC